MSIDLAAMGATAYNWYYLKVDSKNRYHRITVFDKSQQMRREVKTVSTGPISLGNLALTLGRKLHSDEDSTGIVGYIKGFKLFKEMLASDQIVTNVAFQYLHPLGSPNLLIELQLDDADVNGGLFEQVNQFNFQVKGHSVVPERDLSPPWDCFYQAPQDYLELYRFSGPNTQLENITLTNYVDSKDPNGSYQLTVKMWLYREDLASQMGEVTMTPSGAIEGRPPNIFNSSDYDEVLFDHEGIMTMKFAQDSNDYLSIYHFNDDSPSKTLKVKIPRGQWIWLQAEHSENYFSAYIQDMNQRIISKQTQVIKHASRPNFYTAAKSVNIAPNFYGYIRGIQYFRNL